MLPREVKSDGQSNIYRYKWSWFNPPNISHLSGGSLEAVSSQNRKLSKISDLIVSGL